MTRKNDPAVTWIVLAVFFGIIALGLIIGLLIGHWVYMLLLSIPFAVLGAMFILARRAETAAYTQIEGQPGAAFAALGTIRRGWTFAQEPVAVDPRTQDMVFRGVGRPGVVLVGEGPASRIGKLLESERKRTARVISGAPITLIQVRRRRGPGPAAQAAARRPEAPPEADQAGGRRGQQAPHRPRWHQAARAEGRRPDARPPRPQGHARPLIRPDGPSLEPQHALPPAGAQPGRGGPDGPGRRLRRGAAHARAARGRRRRRHGSRRRRRTGGDAPGRGPAPTSRLRYVVGDALDAVDLPGGRQFDLVTCYATLHHLDLEAGLSTAPRR